MAYIDETYHLEGAPGDRFYVMAAVVVHPDDRDPLRNELDHQVPSGWWHTTEALRTPEGREETRDLLRAFQTPDEACVVVHKVGVDPGDKDGLLARGAVLGRLLRAVHDGEGHPPVRLAVLEEQRERRMNNFDRKVRAQLLVAGHVSQEFSMVAVSPGSEHLLWLPDLVCSAYRQRVVFNRNDLFDEIREITRIIETR